MQVRENKTLHRFLFPFKAVAIYFMPGEDFALNENPDMLEEVTDALIATGLLEEEVRKGRVKTFYISDWTFYRMVDAFRRNDRQGASFALRALSSVMQPKTRER